MAPAPTESDTDKASDSGSRKEKGVGSETLKQKAIKAVHGDGKNPTQLGDPVSLKAETSDTEPTEEDRGARGTKKTEKVNPKM